MNQTGKLRGGGTGGFKERESARAFCSGNISNRVGETKIIFPATGGNSIFNTGETASFFFWDFLAAAMALHRQHGCFPSKVLSTAWENESQRRLVASMVVHATVCSAAQCSPVASTRAVTTRNLPMRANTRIN
jgi:hypothetical protein